MRESLARYMATQFIEKQFGADAAEAERARRRLAYESIVKRDATLGADDAPLDATHFNSHTLAIRPSSNAIWNSRKNVNSNVFITERLT